MDLRGFVSVVENVDVVQVSAQHNDLQLAEVLPVNAAFLLC